MLSIIGPEGEVNRLVSDIFWKRLGPLVSDLAAGALAPDVRRRILRHTVSEMLTHLQEGGEGNWDTYLPEEVYIWPPTGKSLRAGEIYEGIGDPKDRFYFLVTPTCDLTHSEEPMFQLVEIRPFSIRSRAKAEPIVKKGKARFHCLPGTAQFRGGLVDFATVFSVGPDQLEKAFRRVGTVIEPFSKDIVCRFGAWISRQGSPDLPVEDVLSKA